jgi:hypothetical protein
MNNSSPIEVFTISLKAFEVRQISTTGYYVACTAASAPFVINRNGTGDFPMRSGFGVPSKSQFTRLTLKNNTNAVISLTLYVCADGVSFFDNMLRNSPTYPRGGGDPVANPGGGIVALDAAGGAKDKMFLSGSDNGNSRCQILITNMSANQNLYVTDTDGKIFAPVFGGMPWTFMTSGGLYVVNPNAGAVQCIIGETFYANL